MKKIKLLYVLLIIAATNFTSQAGTIGHYQIFGPRYVPCDINTLYWTDLGYTDNDGYFVYEWIVKNSAGSTIQTSDNPYINITFPNMNGAYSINLQVFGISAEDEEESYPIHNETIWILNDITPSAEPTTDYLSGDYYGAYTFLPYGSGPYTINFPKYSPIIASGTIYANTTPTSPFDVQPQNSSTNAYIHSGAKMSVHAPAIILQNGFTAESGSSFVANTILTCTTLQSSQTQLREASNQDIKTHVQSAPSFISGNSLKKAYPNPTKGSITIPITNSYINSLIIVIYNSLGQTVYTKTILSTDSHLSNVTADLSALATGMYTIKITADSTTSFQQIVLEK